MNPLVNGINDVLDNLSTLESYRLSSDSVERGYFSKLISRGACLVRYEKDGQLLFGPSRFIGYKKNDRTKHDRNIDKSGGYTNHALERIMGDSFSSYPTIEREFQSFCSKNGIAPSSKKRKYFDISAVPLTEYSDASSDISEIEKDSALGPTEKNQLVAARLGQGDFRKKLIKMWRRCALTGCSNPDLLRASHIKPWAKSSNAERLDPFNGLLLAAHVDAAFDRGLISFDDFGNILFSKRFSSEDRNRLGLESSKKVHIDPKHRPFLKVHRIERFLKG